MKIKRPASKPSGAKATGGRSKGGARSSAQDKRQGQHKSGSRPSGRKTSAGRPQRAQACKTGASQCEMPGAQKSRAPQSGGSHKGGEQDRLIRLSDDLLWGVHPVLEVLKQGGERIAEIILVKDRHGGKREELIELAKQQGVRLTFVSGLKLTGPDASEARHQGIVARVNQTDLLEFDQLLARIREQVASGEKPRIVALDCLQDPHNLGAIIRSAHASGMGAVLVTRERSAPLGGTAAKSAAGAMAHMDICQVTNLAESLQRLQDAGMWVFGAVKDEEAKSIYQTDFDLPLCLVVGGEGPGIRPLVQRRCDVLISIPMQGDLDSLNSSVAAGVIMFEVMRRHLPA